MFIKSFKKSRKNSWSILFIDFKSMATQKHLKYNIALIFTSLRFSKYIEALIFHPINLLLCDIFSIFNTFKYHNKGVAFLKIILEYHDLNSVFETM